MFEFYIHNSFIFIPTQLAEQKAITTKQIITELDIFDHTTSNVCDYDHSVIFGQLMLLAKTL